MKAKIDGRKLGLLGYPLGHSFSKKWFEDKFRREGLEGWGYLLLERSNLEGLKQEIANDSEWLGFNVTVPHKQNILRFLDSVDSLAARIQAVNVVKVMKDGSWRGFNSDYEGFMQTLLNWLPAHGWKGRSAFILGNGGAAGAVSAVLQDLGVDARMVARRPGPDQILWENLSVEQCRQKDLVVHCTPLGMWPDTEEIPPIPDFCFRAGQFVVDLIYNPPKTRLLDAAASCGAITANGSLMLEKQAEKAWKIWIDSD